jgi:hypothetical protein
MGLIVSALSRLGLANLTTDRRKVLPPALGKALNNIVHPNAGGYYAAGGCC